MRKWIVVGIGLIVIGAFFGIFLFKEHPAVLKVFAGSARVLSQKFPASVYVNGIENPRAFCFKVNKSFYGAPRDQIVIWLPDQSFGNGRAVLIVDRTFQEVGLPNNGLDDYDLIWDSFLFQSESGSGYKKFGYFYFGLDPKLKIRAKQVQFVLPSLMGGNRIEIKLF